MIDMLLTSLGKELAFVLFLVATFVFAYLARLTIFQELHTKNKIKDFMANIFQSARCFTLATYLTAAAFATVTILPPPLMAANGNLNLNDVNFGIKIEKIYEKVKRAIDKGGNLSFLLSAVYVTLGEHVRFDCLLN